MMNERIKELVEQATTEEHDGFRYFDKQKFAELIIKECAQRCDPIPGLEFSIEEEAARAGCKKDILKGFGVEQ